MVYSLHYYDLVLGAIAFSVLVGAGVGLATPVSLTLSVAVSSGVAVLFILHALFVRGPVESPEDLTQEVEGELLE